MNDNLSITLNWFMMYDSPTLAMLSKMLPNMKSTLSFDTKGVMVRRSLTHSFHISLKRFLSSANFASIICIWRLTILFHTSKSLTPRSSS